MYRHQTHTLPSNFNNYFSTNATIHTYNTRSRHNLHLNSCKTNTRHFTIRIAGPKLWNAIDPSIRSLTSLNSFKLAYKKLLHACDYIFWVPLISSTCHGVNSCSPCTSFILLIWGRLDKLCELLLSMSRLRPSSTQFLDSLTVMLYTDSYLLITITELLLLP